MLRVTKSRFYVVPVLMRTLDILELLCESNIPLKSTEAYGTLSGLQQAACDF